MIKNKNLNKIIKIHFVGIGGISQSSLAKLMLKRGKLVTGSDIMPTKITKDLEELGVKIYYKHKGSNVKNVDLVVFSGAIKKNNPEIKNAIKKNIKILERSEFLALVASEYINVIAVAGTHGKTTTCGMLASVFVEAGLKPTVHIGGESKNINGNLLIGDKDYFITEACEYKNSFLTLKQTVGVILNVENDHTDCFETVDEVYKSFAKFYKNSKKVNIVCEKYMSALKVDKKKCIMFNLGNGQNYFAKNIRLKKNGHITFYAYKKSEFLDIFELSNPLRHNVYNALAVIAVSDYFNVALDKINKGIKNFLGIKRRLEQVAEINKSIIIHDYAHHPTEIKETISSIQRLYKKPIICVFQPHTYTRTKSLMTDFLKCFDMCKEVIIAKTYPAREKKIKDGTGKVLAKNLNFKNKNTLYIKSYKKIKKYLEENVTDGEIILILGAGDIENLAYNYF